MIVYYIMSCIAQSGAFKLAENLPRAIYDDYTALVRYIYPCNFMPCVLRATVATRERMSRCWPNDVADQSSNAETSLREDECNMLYTRISA